MQYGRLGQTALKVSPIATGCMSFGNPGFPQWTLDEEASQPFTNPRRAAAADTGFTSGCALRIRQFATRTSKTTCSTRWRASPVCR
jgi:hypothetical protein